MYRIRTCLLGFLLLATSSWAFAVPVSTTDGIINTTPGTVAIGEAASYLSGGTGLTGFGGTWPADAGDGFGSVSQEASNIDGYWLQYNSSAPDQSRSIRYEFSTATNEVVAVAGLDHGPLPYEALEFIVWGWDASASSWVEGAITAIYEDGVNAAWTSDDYSSIWSFSDAYSIFAVSGGDHLGVGATEGEIDGLALRATSVPEPGSVALLGLGLAALGFARWRPGC